MEWSSIQGAKQCCTSQPQICRVNEAVTGCSMNRPLQEKVYLNSPAGYSRGFVSVQEECVILIACFSSPLPPPAGQQRIYFYPLHFYPCTSQVCSYNSVLISLLTSFSMAVPARAALRAGRSHCSATLHFHFNAQFLIVKHSGFTCFISCKRNTFYKEKTSI